MVQQSLLLNVSLLISPNQVSWWLLGNMKHDTSSIILYMCLAISARSIWPLLSPDTRIPFLRPGAFFFFFLPLLLLLLRGNRYIRSSSSEEWGDDDEQSQPEQTFCLNFWQDIQQLTVSAFVGPIANSCKLTIWRQQLWAMKGLKIKRREHLRGRKNTKKKNTKWLKPVSKTWPRLKPNALNRWLHGNASIKCHLCTELCTKMAAAWVFITQKLMWWEKLDKERRRPQVFCCHIKKKCMKRK